MFMTWLISVAVTGWWVKFTVDLNVCVSSLNESVGQKFHSEQRLNYYLNNVIAQSTFQNITLNSTKLSIMRLLKPCLAMKTKETLCCCDYICEYFKKRTKEINGF